MSIARNDFEERAPELVLIDDADRRLRVIKAEYGIILQTSGIGGVKPPLGVRLTPGSDDFDTLVRVLSKLNRGKL